MAFRDFGAGLQAAGRVVRFFGVPRAGMGVSGWGLTRAAGRERVAVMKRRLLFSLMAVAAGLVTAKAADAPAGRPNIIYIMSDDHAAHAISAYGSKVNETPNLDRLAKEGMRFDRAYVTNSICTPSRATLLTGKYSHKNGVPVFNRFDGAQPVVSRFLQQAGYFTGMYGKWHLGSDPTGFDKWEILPGQGAYFDPMLYTAEGSKKHQGYVTDVITDLAIDFLKNRPKEKPFFLCCHHKAPHRPWEPAEKYKKIFASKVIPEPATLWDDYTGGRTDALRENRQRVADDLTRRDLKLTPPQGLKGPELNKWLGTTPMEVETMVGGEMKKLTGHELAKWKYQRYMQDYLACIQSMDDGIGKLLDYLKESGLEGNTIVMYTADNGFFLGDHGLFDKRFMYEESLRIPLLVRWPGVTPAGSTCQELALNVDFAETFLEAAGLPVPADMQGKSLVPVLKGQHPGDWRKSFYYRYYHDPGDHNTRAHLGVRTETHKLIYFWKKDQWEMYDLVKDPAELKNVYNDPEQAGKVAELKAEIERLKRQLGDTDEFADGFPAGGVDGQGPKPRPVK